jgi:hypothetical protein
MSFPTMVALTPVEAKELTSWIMNHLNKCATQGSDIIITQETGGIGIKTTVKCVDSSEHDITDYTRW